MRKKLLIITFVLALALIAVLPAAAQTDTVTLELDATTITNGLFEGANIMIAALGTIMFLLAGFKLGGNLLRSLVNAVSGRIF